MREDMFKIIVERPRAGWRSAPRNRGRLSGADDLPTKIGMKRHVAVTRNKTKWLNENLKPLERYLGRQVGRRWDDVYSEIAATLAPGHTVKEHVRQHLDDFVARTVSFDKDGTPMNGNGRRRWSAHLPWRQRYYVDPEDGVLKRSESLWKTLGIDPQPWKRRKSEADPDMRALDPMRELRRIDGVWYEVRFDRIEDTNAWVYDLLLRKLVPANQRHAAAKRQLSRTELDTHEIENSYND